MAADDEPTGTEDGAADDGDGAADTGDEAVDAGAGTVNAGDGATDGGDGAANGGDGMRPCETPEALLAWAESYAADVVAERDLDVDLARVEWEVSHRAKRRAGATISARVPDAEVGEPVDWDEVAVDPDCTVRLTWRAYQELGHEAMAATIRHELVHVEQVQAYGTTGHGAAFRERAAALDAPVHCESFTPARYLLTCEACDELVARRYRRSKLVRRHDEYRSRCCGAALSLERNADA